MQPERPRRNSLAAGTAISAGARIASVSVALVVTPFIVHEIGLHNYGIWALASMALNYAGVLDFGVGPAVSRFGSRAVAIGDSEQLRRYHAAGRLLTWGGVAIVIAAIGTVLAVVPGLGFEGPAAVAVVGAGTALVFIVLASPHNAIARAHERWDLNAIPPLAFQTTSAVLTIVLLSEGMGLSGLGLAAAGGGLTFWAAAWGTQRLMWPDSFGRISRAHRNDARELLGYGTNVQVAMIMEVVNSQIDKPAILAAGGSLQQVASYELITKLLVQLKSLPISAIGPLTVRYAHMHGQLDSDFDVAQAYRRSVTVVTIFGTAPLLIAYGWASILLLGWIGPQISSGLWMLAALAPGYVAAMSSGAGVAVMNAIGRSDLQRKYALLCLAMNLGFSLAGGVLFGPPGVIVATGAGLVLASGWFNRQASRTAADGRDIDQGLGVYQPILVALPIGLVLAGVAYAIRAEGQLLALLAAAISGGVAVCAYVSAVPATRAIAIRLLPDRFAS